MYKQTFNLQKIKVFWKKNKKKNKKQKKIFNGEKSINGLLMEKSINGVVALRQNITFLRIS